MSLNIHRTTGALDRAGIAASTVCAVHCILSPLLLVLLPLMGLGILAGESAEWVFIGVSIGLGALSLLPSYFRWHKRANAVIIFTAGIIIITLARSFEDYAEIETFGVVVGALCLVAAHWMNRRLCRACPSCTTPRADG